MQRLLERGFHEIMDGLQFNAAAARTGSYLR
jgi:hypothetical protein